MPVGRLYTYFCYFPMDIKAMRRAASYLIGEHDFKSFCTVRTQAEETVRTIYDLTVERGSDDVVTIRITGSGFLYNMVKLCGNASARGDRAVSAGTCGRNPGCQKPAGCRPYTPRKGAYVNPSGL